MELRGKRILLFSPEPWQGLHMSKHHLAQALAKRGNTVYFVDPPRPGNKGFVCERIGDVQVVRYRHWLRGVNRMPLWVNRWYYKRLILDLSRTYRRPVRHPLELRYEPDAVVPRWRWEEAPAPRRLRYSLHRSRNSSPRPTSYSPPARSWPMKLHHARPHAPSTWATRWTSAG